MSQAFLQSAFSLRSGRPFDTGAQAFYYTMRGTLRLSTDIEDGKERLGNEV